MCDKPMTFDLAQAEQLAAAVDQSGVVFAVTHNYTGYPLVRQAREMILVGRAGRDQRDSLLLHPGLAAHAAGDAVDQKQAAWRTDPSKSGAAGCFGDIGTHAYNLARYMTGLLPESISCQPQDLRRGPQAGRLRPRR